MIYSATTEYAIRALSHLATLEPGQRILARDLAAATDVPRQFLGKILHRLARAGMLDSAKGRGGGFKFQTSAEDVIVADVVKVFDKTKVCVLGLDDCNDLQPCPMHDEWVKFRARLNDRVQSTSFADLGEVLKKKRAEMKAAGIEPTPAVADDDPAG